VRRIDGSGTYTFFFFVNSDSRVTKYCCYCDLRDNEFDLENDKLRCLKGLDCDDESEVPPAVLRLTQIFEQPQYVVDGADAVDIIQGGLGDCWLLSALATMTTSKGLIEKLCVAVSRVHHLHVVSLIYTTFFSATKRLVCMDLCSSVVLLGLMLLSTSKNGIIQHPSINRWALMDIYLI
jgi:hypothetical protein